MKAPMHQWLPMAVTTAAKAVMKAAVKVVAVVVVVAVAARVNRSMVTTPAKARWMPMRKQRTTPKATTVMQPLPMKANAAVAVAVATSAMHLKAKP